MGSLPAAFRRVPGIPGAVGDTGLIFPVAIPVVFTSFSQMPIPFVTSQQVWEQPKFSMYPFHRSQVAAFSLPRWYRQKGADAARGRPWAGTAVLLIGQAAKTRVGSSAVCARVRAKGAGMFELDGFLSPAKLPQERYCQKMVWNRRETRAGVKSKGHFGGDTGPAWRFL